MATPEPETLEPTKAVLSVKTNSAGGGVVGLDIDYMAINPKLGNKEALFLIALTWIDMVKSIDDGNPAAIFKNILAVHKARNVGAVDVSEPSYKVDRLLN